MPSPSSPKRLTARFANSWPMSARRRSPACEALFRLPRLAFRRAVLSVEAEHFSQHFPFFLLSHSPKAGRIASCLWQFVAQMNRSEHGTQITIAARLILGFISRMIRISRSGSKLFACSTRPAQSMAYMPSAVLQLAKEGRSLPLDPSPVRLCAASETLRVSKPSAVRP
jgi:hypothetical protein